MKKGNVLLLIFGLIVLLAVLTNPSPDRHKEAIKIKLKAYMQKSMTENMNDSSTGFEQLGQVFGMLLGSAIIEPIVDNLISTDNYFLFSITKITWDGETKVIGVGVLNNVFITKELDKAMDKGFLENNNKSEKINLEI